VSFSVWTSCSKADPLRNVVHQDQTPDPVSGFSNPVARSTRDNQIPAAPIPHGKLYSWRHVPRRALPKFQPTDPAEHFVEFSADAS